MSSILRLLSFLSFFIGTLCQSCTRNSEGIVPDIKDTEVFSCVQECQEILMDELMVVYDKGGDPAKHNIDLILQSLPTERYAARTYFTSFMTAFGQSMCTDGVLEHMHRIYTCELYCINPALNCSQIDEATEQCYDRILRELKCNPTVNFCDGLLAVSSSKTYTLNLALLLGYVFTYVL